MKLNVVGLGPGDPELLTLKAVKCLKESDVVVAPKSNELDRSIAKEIIRNYVDESKIFTYYFPMNNDRKLLQNRYKELAEEIFEFLQQGKKVSYVTIGDPSVYSTFIYLGEELKKMSVKMEIISGIPSFVELTNRLGFPLCKKGEQFCVIEGDKIESLDMLLNFFDQIVVMKAHRAIKRLKAICNERYDLDIYVGCKVGLDGEIIYDLREELKFEELYLSTIIIRRKDVQ